MSGNTFIIMEEELMLSIIKGINQKGWSPATSTNYSFIKNQEIIISRSGVDKEFFTLNDFIKIDDQGNLLSPYEQFKTSAETLIHCFIYKHFPSTRCILHSHSIPSTILPTLQKNNEHINFGGYEIIKGIKGNETHQTNIQLPVFDNEQDMPKFCKTLENRRDELTNFGFLMNKHGLYVWGDNILEAKRHLETWEYLLQCELTLHQ